MGIEDSIHIERARREVLDLQRRTELDASSAAAADARTLLQYFVGVASRLETALPIVAFTSKSGFFGTKYEATTLARGWVLDLVQFTAPVPRALERTMSFAVTTDASVVGGIIPSSAFLGEEPYRHVQRGAPHPSLICVAGRPILLFDDPIGYEQPTQEKAMGRIVFGQDQNPRSTVPPEGLAQYQRGYLEWGGARHPVVPLERVLANWIVDRSS